MVTYSMVKSFEWLELRERSLRADTAQFPNAAREGLARLEDADRVERSAANVRLIYRYRRIHDFHPILWDESNHKFSLFKSGP